MSFKEDLTINQFVLESGDGSLALVAIKYNLPYVGLCLSAEHVQSLIKHKFLNSIVCECL